MFTTVNITCPAQPTTVVAVVVGGGDYLSVHVTVMEHFVIIYVSFFYNYLTGNYEQFFLGGASPDKVK